MFIERVFRDIDGAAVWCDVVQSTAKETCTDIARLSLDDALLWIRERYGTNIESWRWGDAHQATHDHPVLGKVPVLRYFVNIRQSTSGGDNTLMRGLTKASGPDPFLNVHGAGYRGVYDFADPGQLGLHHLDRAIRPSAAAATTTIWASCGGAANISRCRSTPALPARRRWASPS